MPRVGRSQMLPVLSREVVEGKQRVAILDQSLSYLTPQVSMKASNAASASFLVSAIQISTGYAPTAKTTSDGDDDPKN